MQSLLMDYQDLPVLIITNNELKILHTTLSKALCSFEISHLWFD